jgi:hypothetical protein
MACVYASSPALGFAMVVGAEPPTLDWASQSIGCGPPSAAKTAWLAARNAIGHTRLKCLSGLVVSCLLLKTASEGRPAELPVLPDVLHDARAAFVGLAHTHRASPSVRRTPPTGCEQKLLRFLRFGVSGPSGAAARC